MTAHDSLDRRRAIAHHLYKIPTACPADVHEWAETGYSLEWGGDLEDVRVPHPNTSSGVFCAMEAVTHKHGCCWCGKFRAGLEVSDGR